MLSRKNRKCALAIVALLMYWSRPLNAEPFTPSVDSQVLETLPAATNSTAVEIRQLRTQLMRQPGDAALAANIARRYIELGRVESDPRYYGYAQGVLQHWWAVEQPPADILLLRATLRQNRHEFDAALKDLKQLLNRDPRNAQAWLTQAVIEQVRGDYASARRSCMPLLHLADTLLAVACLSNVGSVTGQAQNSFTLLNSELSADATMPPADLQWALVSLAEIAVRTGKAQDAERLFKTALAQTPHDPYLLASFSDFLLDQGRPAEVQALLSNNVRIDALLLRLTLAEQQLKSETAAAHIAMLSARFAASRLRGDSVHQGEEARFTLHLLRQPQNALKLAQSNWAVQKEPRDARILLEAALASGKAEAAQPVIEMIKHTGLEDVQLARLVTQLQGAIL
jgi:Tfp pilus assembly protein PilF